MHCWQSAPLAGKGTFSSLIFDECKRFLDDTIEMGLKNITFSGGEPLLNPEFLKFAEYFHSNNIHMNIETNGILIPDKDILNAIRKAGIYCAISLDGVKPETHNKHRANKNAFKQTVRSIKVLEDEKRYYQLIMSISHFNYDELLPLLDWIKENCKYCNKLKINIVQGRGRGEKMDEKGLLFKAPDLPGISDEIALLVPRYPFELLLHVDPAFISFKNMKLKYSCGGHCGYLNALSILANGNISICSMGKQIPDYIFGHVSSINVKDVWTNNPTLAEIHEDTHSKLKGVCSNCIFRKNCYGGCRAEALCVYGDFFAPHPLCQDYYNSGKFPTSRLIDAAKDCTYEKKMGEILM
jgi:pyrroloquinoline quinone biosynthesis protein E